MNTELTYLREGLMTLAIFEEIERLIEYIPIDSGILSNCKLSKGTTMDSQFHFQDVDGVATRLGIIEVGRNTVSLKDVVKLFNKFLKDASVEEIIGKQWYRQIQNISRSDLPLRNLLFDFCLAALDGDIVDAKLYLTHSLYLLGLHRRLTQLLSVILNEVSLESDKDVRQLLTLLAQITEPNNIDIYFDVDINGFNKRYSIYLNELQKLTPIYNKEIQKSKKLKLVDSE